MYSTAIGFMAIVSFHYQGADLGSMTLGADPGFLLGGVAPQRNGVTEWWRKQMFPIRIE